ncbi:MAG: hypothetical protein ACRDRQ_21075 [Pseudonocardiaceae bacterium]
MQRSSDARSTQDDGGDGGGTAVNIREVIEKLHEVATRLPDGLDSEVQVHICNGTDPGLMTPSIEVDTMWAQNQETLAVSSSFAVIQGHPHRDESNPPTRPATAEIDDLVEKWAADQRGVQNGAGRADLIKLRSSEGEYALLPCSDGRFVKFTLVDGQLQYLPGAPDAVAAGCLCDPGRNNNGRGHRRDGAVQMVIKDGCPLHPKIEGPVDPDDE